MTCSSNVVNTLRGHANKENKESVNILENNERSNKNLNPTRKPNEKTLTDNHNTENKDSNEKIGRPLLKNRTIQRTKLIKRTKTLRKKDNENKGGKENNEIKKKDKGGKRKEKEGKNKANGNIGPRKKSKIYI